MAHVTDISYYNAVARGVDGLGSWSWDTEVFLLYVQIQPKLFVTPTVVAVP